MRELTVHRIRSFAGCLGKVRVLVEDRENGENTVRGVPVTLLGTLKNGEEKRFSIPGDARMVFVIADELTKDFCGDVITVPAGREAVRLEGKNTFDPQSGNPFRFLKRR